MKLLAISIHRALCFVFKFQFKLTLFYFIICVCCTCQSMGVTVRRQLIEVDSFLDHMCSWVQRYLSALPLPPGPMLGEFGTLSWEVSAFSLDKVIKVLRKRNNFFRFVFQKVASRRTMKQFSIGGSKVL